MKRALFLALYYGLLQWLPSSRRMGGVPGFLRYQCCRHVFDSCGTKVNIERRAFFGSGSTLKIGNNSGIGVGAKISPYVEIGDNVLMGEDVVFLTQNHNYKNYMEFYLKLNWDPKFSQVRCEEETIRREIGAASIEEYRRRFGTHYDAGNCRRLWTEPQINWDGRVLGCTRNFWGEFGAINAFDDGLQAAVNSPEMRYAREMLLGNKPPPREDIPCATCDIYMDRKAQREWVPRNSVDPSVAYRGARFIYRAVRHGAFRNRGSLR